MPLVSFAIPIYNVEKTIKTSLLSALAQTYSNIEYLLIDDKSTDCSMQIVDELIANHPRKKQIKIIDHIVNRGLGDTRNTAIEQASGKYIFFMDSDDLVTPDCIEKLVNYMKETPVDFIASSRTRKSFEGKIIGEDIYTSTIINKNSPLSVAHFRYVQNHKILGEVWNKLYELNFLRENNIRCIPGVHVEDVSFSFQVNLHATSCRLVPDVTYTYHIYEGQSFAAFKNNKQRALYLADCFIKIRNYDVSLLQQLPKNTYELGALCCGIYNVVLLHSGMIQRSTILTKNDKLNTFKKLWVYPYTIKDVLQLKSKKIFNLLFLLFSFFPTPLQYLIISYRNRNYGK